MMPASTPLSLCIPQWYARYEAGLLHWAADYPALYGEAHDRQ